ncbi:MAG: hypothetical protein ACMXYF_01345 [Candidatus Woesearchaeota archaeon]
MTNDKQAIRKEAFSIMKSFYTALSSVDVKDVSIGVNREIQLRDDEPQDGDATFRDAFFANAPQKDQDYVYAEKKTWK